jgi:hypothetical protein
MMKKEDRPLQHKVPKSRNVSFYLSVETINSVFDLAVRRRTSMSKILREALAAYLLTAE